MVRLKQAMNRAQHRMLRSGPAKNSVARGMAATAALPEEADVVVIGGGSLGASACYHLQKQGLSTVLLEAHQLTAGTTWHTAGMLWRLRPSYVDIELHTYTRDMCMAFEKDPDIDTPSWVENGGLFIACNKERLAECVNDSR